MVQGELENSSSSREDGDELGALANSLAENIIQNEMDVVIQQFFTPSAAVTGNHNGTHKLQLAMRPQSPLKHHPYHLFLQEPGT